MADSNDFQDDPVDSSSDDTSSTPNGDDTLEVANDDSIDSPGDVDEEASLAPEPVQDATPSEEEVAAREAEAALLLIFQSTVYDKDGAKIGRVGQVYLDDQTQEPNWVTVKTGLFGTKEFFIPLDEAERSDKRITVPYEKSKVHAAPFTEIDQNLSPEEEDELYNYYEVPGRMSDEGTLNIADPDDDAPKQKAEPQTIAPLGGTALSEDEPLSTSSLLGDETEAGSNADQSSSSAFDDIVADNASGSGTPAADSTESDASPFDALGGEDAEVETPERGNADELSFGAFADDPDRDNGASPFDRPNPDK